MQPATASPKWAETKNMANIHPTPFLDGLEAQNYQFIGLWKRLQSSITLLIFIVFLSTGAQL